MQHNINVDADLAATQRLCETIDTARSLTVYLLIKYTEFPQLINLKIDPLEYDSAALFSCDYMITKFLSKWKGFKKCYNTRDVAIAGWFACEQHNQQTNNRLRNEPQAAKPDVDRVITRARQKIAQILGPLPNLSTVFNHCSWSNGGTFDLRRGTDFTRKMTSRLTVTHGARWYASHLVGHDPTWFEALTGIKLDGPACYLIDPDSIVKGNKLDTVPKSSKTDRVICIEPTMNIYIQKGFGAIIRSRLKTWGVDLDDQTKNQYLSSIAQKLQLATIDLSSASDTINSMLVLDLLPIDWFCCLDQIRSKQTFHKTWIPQQKFSSMGNGFTFELESVIFYGIAAAVCDELGLCNWYTTTYGDDIIVPAVAYPLLQSVLTHCGFIVNTEKSFSSGVFYESCGKHYFDGIDVTPAYQKEISAKPEEIIRAHNRLYRWSMRTGHPVLRATKTYLKAFKAKGLDYVPRIPEWSDDRGFLSSPGTLGPFDRNHGFRCVVYQNIPQYRKTREVAFLAYKLSHPGMTSSDRKGQAKVSRSTTVYRFKKVFINL